MAPFAAKRTNRCVALRRSLSVAVQVVLPVEVALGIGVILEVRRSAPINEVVLTTSSHLLVLTNLVVSPVLCHLSVPAFCNVMSCSLAKGTKFIVSTGRGSLGFFPFPASHHGMSMESTIATVT